MKYNRLSNWILNWIQIFESNDAFADERGLNSDSTSEFEVGLELHSCYFVSNCMIWAYKTSIFHGLIWINSNMVLNIKDQVQLSPSSVRQKVY